MKRTAGILIAWAGYAVGTWGWVLWKRYNISFVQWVNPVTPYVWPAAGTVPSIPDDRVFPGASSADTTSAGGGKHKPTQVGVVDPEPGNKCRPGFRYNPHTHECDRIPVVVPR